MTGERATAHGAGRTDAGVHALGQAAHVDLERDWEPFRLAEGLNAHLVSHPVAILGAERVAHDFDARHSARARCYLYRIVNRRAPLTLTRGRAWRVKPRLDAEAMLKAASEQPRAFLSSVAAFRQLSQSLLKPPFRVGGATTALIIVSV